MKVVVTGANGFIGSALVEALVARGDSVICVLFPGTSADWLACDQVRFIDGDVTRPGPEFVKALTEADEIYHLAGARIGLTPAHFMRVNAGGTRTLLEICRDHATHLERFVFVSSATVCGPSAKGQFRDETSTNPLTPYAKSKAEAERIALTEFAGQVPVTVIRPGAIYGRRTTEWVDMLQLVSQWGRFAIFGVFREEPELDLLHVDDLVEGMLVAAAHPDAVGETFILSGTYKTWTTLGHTVSAAIGKTAKPLYIPIPVLWAAAYATHGVSLLLRRPFEFNIWRAVDFSQSGWTFTSDKAKRVLGWEPRQDFEAAAGRTVRWFIREGWVPAPKGLALDQLTDVDSLQASAAAANGPSNAPTDGAA